MLLKSDKMLHTSDTLYQRKQLCYTIPVVCLSICSNVISVSDSTILENKCTKVFS